jgi:tRNA(Ile)-lysidine synthase
MLQKVKIPKDRHVTVALSGGADSVALLHALLELGLNVTCCHVNHNLRGAESDTDEAFVRDLCKKWGVKVTVCSLNVKSLQKKHQSLEEAARNARYAFFSEFETVATAHTASDNAETVLLNLIRGTGLKGLCGIPPVRDNIIRPLIECQRSDIEEYCKKHDLDYVTDSTNHCEEFTRNKIRMRLIPVIKQINPAFDCTVTRMCEILREDSDFLENTAQCCDYSIKQLSNLEKPLLKRIIIGLLSHNNISPSNLRVSQIIEIIDNGQGKINLEKHKFALISDGILKIETIYQNYR